MPIQHKYSDRQEYLMAILFTESRAHGPGELDGEGFLGPTGPAISIRGLNFTYDEGGRPKQVLFDIDLDIWPGEIALLTGPSGCGKTTLLTLIGGLRTGQTSKLVGLGRQLHTCVASDLPEVRR